MMKSSISSTNCVCALTTLKPILTTVAWEFTPSTIKTTIDTYIYCFRNNCVISDWSQMAHTRSFVAFVLFYCLSYMCHVYGMHISSRSNGQ